jgi:hypothetical protein
MGWTGRAPAPNGSQSAPGGCQERSTTMPRTTTLHAVTAIGIDMGKNTLHLIGLDARGDHEREQDQHRRADRPLDLIMPRRVSTGDRRYAAALCRGWPRRCASRNRHGAARTFRPARPLGGCVWTNVEIPLRLALHREPRMRRALQIAAAMSIFGAPASTQEKARRDAP